MKNKKSEQAENNRTKIMLFRATQTEAEFIKNRAAKTSVKSLSEYLRRMAIFGYVVNVNLTELKELTTSVIHIRANINQIAKRINSTGRVYNEDIEYMKKATEEIWESVKLVQSKLLSQ